MGILTSTDSAKKFSKLITDYGSVLSCVTYGVSLLMFMSLFHPLLWEKTYFSENALLPGLVKSDYNPGSKEVNRMYQSYTQRMEMTKPTGMSWIHSRLQSIGVDVYTQPFTFTRPGDTQSTNGSNVYGVIRAPRSCSTESIVIVVPTNTTHSDVSQGVNAGGVGLLLSLSQRIVRKNHWAKDIILLFSDHGLTGVRVWLEAYHGTSGKMLPAVAGAIQAAIGVELESETFGSIDIKYFGMESQLVNLDLFNTAVRLCKREQVLCTINNRPDSPHNLNNVDKIHYLMGTALSGLMTQAAGKITGVHSLFLPYHIEAITLTGVAAGDKQHGFTPVGRVLEGVMRSLNNLLERLHHSFFFYFLPSTDLYISIGMYTVPFVVLLLTPVIQLVKLWFQVTESRVGDRVCYSLPSVAGVIPTFLLCQLVGAAFYLCPGHVTGPSTILPTHLSLTLLSALLVSGLNRSAPLTPADWRVRKMFSILWYCVVLVNSFVHNYPLAWFVLIPTAPLVSFLPVPGGTRSTLLTLPLVLISPVVVLLGYCYVSHGTDVSDVYERAQSILHTAYVEYEEFNRHTYWLYCWVLYPLWLMFWGLHTSRVTRQCQPGPD